MPVKPKRRRRNDHPLALRNLPLRDVVNVTGAILGWRTDDFIQSWDDLKIAWEVNRNDLMTLKTPQNNYCSHGYDPGTRPLLWWAFSDDVSEQLRLIEERTINSEEPKTQGEIIGVVPVYESQEDYLIRHQILTDCERDICERERAELTEFTRSGYVMRQQSNARRAAECYEKGRSLEDE